jgi:hypothetical protein
MAYKNPEEGKAYHAAWYQRNREKRLAQGLAWRLANKERIKDTDKKWRAANPLKVRAWWRQKVYNLTPEDFNELLAAQNGCCAACLSPDPGHKYGWQIDHNHKTGKVRAILCRPCNLALGHAGELPSRLRALASYIEIHTPGAP